MNFKDTNFSEIPNIALGKSIPDSVRIRQIEKEAENERYEELESLLKQIREATKEQVDYARFEAESARKSAKKNKQNSNYIRCRRNNSSFFECCNAYNLSFTLKSV